MSKSVARQHLKLLLQRTAFVDAADRKAQEEQEQENMKTSSKYTKQKRPASNQKISKESNLPEGTSMLNPYVKAVDDFNGSEIEIARQVKHARKVIRQTSATTSERTEKQKQTSLNHNLSLLLRSSNRKAKIANKMTEVRSRDILIVSSFAESSQTKNDNSLFPHLPIFLFS